MGSPTKPMGVKLPDRDRERLKKLADARKRTPHWLVKEAIIEYLDREETVERFRQESITAWEEYQRTGKSVPNDEVMAWLDSWGGEKERKEPA